MAVFLLCGTAKSDARNAIESALLTQIPGVIEVSTFKEIFERLENRSDPTIVLIVAPTGNHAYFNRLIDVASQYRDKVFLILISDEISASDYKRLVRTGAADWASAKGGPREVADIISRFQQPERKTETLQPITISFVPSAGGVGNSTLALETAIHIRTNKTTQERKVCIVDLDFQTSHVCDYLDCEPRLHIENIADAPERIDEQLFDIFTTHHRSGVDVFAAPRSKFSSDSVDVKSLDALFNMIAKRYDLVLIDHPLTWFPWTRPVINASDAAIVTGLNTIPCLRLITETLALIRSSAPPVLQVAIALNRCQRTLVGGVARNQHVTRVLQGEQVFYISHRTEAIEAVNMGVPMMLGSAAGKVQKEFAPLAKFCAEIKATRSALT